MRAYLKVSETLSMEFLIFSFFLEYVMRIFSNRDFVGINLKLCDKDYKGRYSTSIFIFLISLFLFLCFSPTFQSPETKSQQLTCLSGAQQRTIDSVQRRIVGILSEIIFFAVLQHFFTPICLDLIVFSFLFFSFSVTDFFLLKEQLWLAAMLQ